jgi:hypothetical protein
MRAALIACLAALGLNGCAVYEVASTAVDVTTTAVSTTADAVGTIVSAPFGGGDSDKKKSN